MARCTGMLSPVTMASLTSASPDNILQSIGTIIGQGAQFAYYETTATILTFVFFGNYLEDASIASTQRALKDLVKAQKVMANMIVFDEHHKEIIFNVSADTLK
ncbi:MAG: hypothetical protein ACKOGD_09205, partial [Sphingomonadales bacterium]